MKRALALALAVLFFVLLLPTPALSDSIKLQGSDLRLLQTYTNPANPKTDWRWIISDQTGADASGYRDQLAFFGFNHGPTSPDPTRYHMGMAFESYFNGGGEWYISMGGGAGGRATIRPIAAYTNYTSTMSQVDLQGKVNIFGTDVVTGAQIQMWNFGNGLSDDSLHSVAGGALLNHVNNVSMLKQVNSAGDSFINFATLDSQTPNTWQVSSNGYPVNITHYLRVGIEGNDNFTASPSSALVVAGGMQEKWRLGIGPDTMTHEDIILFWNPTAGTDEVTLPTLTGASPSNKWNGKIIKVVNITATTASVAPAAGDSIQVTGGKVSLPGNGTSVTLTSYGTKWYILSYISVAP